MPHDATAWFTTHILRQAHDEALVRHGVHVDFYFDAAQLRNAAVGAHAYYRGDFFDREHFLSQAALVEALFSAGWIGPVRMLPAHQSEFLSLLQLDFSIAEEDVAHVQERFLTDVQLPAHATPQELIRNPTLAETAFKAVEAVRMPWRERLSDWRERGLLDLETITVQHATLLRTSEFQRLSLALNKLRPHARMSNLADAAALAALATAVEDYERGISRRLPLLLSSGLFLRAVNQAKLQARFEFRGSNGSRWSALCSPDYFLFKAIFRPAAEAMHDQGERVATEGRELVALAQNLLQTTQSEADLKEIVRVIAEPEFNVHLGDLRHFTFFQTTWLPFALRVKRKGDTSFAEAIQALSNKAVRNEVAVHITQLKKVLGDATRDFHDLREIWTYVNRATQRLHEVLPALSVRDIDPLLVSGLVRFSFPENTRSYIRNYLGRLLAGDEHFQFNFASQVLHLVRSKSEEEEDTEEFYSAVAVLWVAQVYKPIIHLLERRHNKHYSLRILLTAAHIMNHDDKSNIQRAIQELEREYDRATGLEQMRLAVGVSYLSYRFGLYCGYQPSWMPEEPGGRALTGSDWIDKAVRYARVAATYNAEGEERLALPYATNLALYYAIARGTAPAQLRSWAIRLLRFKNDSSIWQYRFEDTLARYFYLRAQHATDDQERNSNLDLAEQHVRDALRTAGNDEEVEQFRDIVALARDVPLSKP